MENLKDQAGVAKGGLLKALNLMPQNTVGGTLIKTEAEVMKR